MGEPQLFCEFCGGAHLADTGWRLCPAGGGTAKVTSGTLLVYLMSHVLCHLGHHDRPRSSSSMGTVAHVVGNVTTCTQCM
jgi:hypothetical protein